MVPSMWTPTSKFPESFAIFASVWLKMAGIGKITCGGPAPSGNSK